MGNGRQHILFLKNLQQKAQKEHEKKHQEKLQFERIEEPLNLPSEIGHDDAMALFKKRTEKNHQKQSDKISEDIERNGAKIASAISRKGNIGHRRNPEEPFGYSKDKLKEGEFNPILSSQKFSLGPGRYRLDHLQAESQLESPSSEKRKKRMHDSRSVNLPYKKFITLEIFTLEQFSLRFHKFYEEDIKNKIRDTHGAKFLMDLRCWVLSIGSYDHLMHNIQKLCDQHRIHIEEIPSFVMNLVLHKTPFTGPEMVLGHHNYTNDPFEPSLIDKLPKSILDNLKLHQRHAIEKSLKRHGRIILNDSLGLGKKLVAIALSIIYKPEWPLLIICPFVLRHAWQEEFVRWIPNIKLEYIQVFGSSTAETLNPAAKIYIISYQLITHEVVLKRFEERGFKLAIVDQASYLKCHDSDWSQALLPFLFALRRVIMLAGSNFQENPLEIYNLLKVIRPDYMPDFLKFCMRYADPLKRPDGVEFIGRSFSHELSQLFRKRFALRRNRDDENIEVESFTRQKIEISGVQGIVKGVLQEINEGPFAQYEEAHPG